MLSRIILSIVLFLLINPVVLPGGAKAQEIPEDAGLVIQLKGKADYANETDAEKLSSVEPFMKIRRGDRIELADGSSMDLLFFSSRRKETWVGPSVIHIYPEGARASGQTLADQPQKSTAIDPNVVVNIAHSDLPLPRSQTARAGVMVLRSVAPYNNDAVEREYKALKKSAPAGDPLPDLYYLSVLSMYGKFGEINEVIDEMLEKDPDNQVLKQWKIWAAKGGF